METLIGSRIQEPGQLIGCGTEGVCLASQQRPCCLCCGLHGAALEFHRDVEAVGALGRSGSRSA